MTHPPPVAAPRTPVGIVLAIGRDIKLSHTVFALPFAILGGLLAASWAQRLITWWELGLILAAMFLARTMAMTFNRLIDARLDAANPRTKQRAIPAGRVSPTAMGVATATSAVLLMVAAGGFWVLGNNPWPVMLSPVVIAVLLAYSLTKRLTRWCHLVLGLSLGLSPLAAAVAIEPGYLAKSPDAWLLAAMVLCWVAGFDIIYALQDVAVDRQAGLHSLPSRLGPGKAMWVSRLLHALATTCLIAIAITSQLLGSWFAIGVGLVAVLLIVEHALVWSPARRRIAAAFLTVNGIVSLLLGAMGAIDLLLA